MGNMILEKAVYPVIIYKKEENEKYHVVYVPDFDVTTQGETIYECIEMAKDIIGITGIDLEDEGKEVPMPFTNDNEYAFNDTSFEIEEKTMVNLDFTEYRRKLENKPVKKTLTIPYNLNKEAEKLGVNFSRVLQEALSKIIKKVG